jgi:hypothetical protein
VTLSVLEIEGINLRLRPGDGIRSRPSPQGTAESRQPDPASLEVLGLDPKMRRFVPSTVRWMIEPAS